MTSKSRPLFEKIFCFLFLAVLVYESYQFYFDITSFFIDPYPNLILFTSSAILGLSLILALVIKYFKTRDEHGYIPHKTSAILFFTAFLVLLGAEVMKLSDYQHLIVFFVLGLQIYLVVKKYFSSRDELSRGHEFLSLLLFPLFFSNGVALLPLSSLDKDFNQDIKLLNRATSTLSEKLTFCEAVHQRYPQLKGSRKNTLEKTCAGLILNTYKKDPAQLEIAFKWLHNRTSKKPGAAYHAALACLYAEKKRPDYALAIAKKNKLQKIEREITASGHCDSFSNRNVASE